jgi:hypothetical protein
MSFASAEDAMPDDDDQSRVWKKIGLEIGEGTIAY